MGLLSCAAQAQARATARDGPAAASPAVAEGLPSERSTRRSRLLLVGGAAHIQEVGGRAAAHLDDVLSGGASHTNTGFTLLAYARCVGPQATVALFRARLSRPFSLGPGTGALKHGLAASQRPQRHATHHGRHGQAKARNSLPKRIRLGNVFPNKKILHDTHHGRHGQASAVDLVNAGRGGEGVKQSRRQERAHAGTLVSGPGSPAAPTTAGWRQRKRRPQPGGGLWH